MNANAEAARIYNEVVALAWNAADTNEAYAWVMRNGSRPASVPSSAWKPECATVAPARGATIVGK